jgi:hypothetical protein
MEPTYRSAYGLSPCCCEESWSAQNRAQTISTTLCIQLVTGVSTAHCINSRWSANMHSPQPFRRIVLFAQPRACCSSRGHYRISYMHKLRELNLNSPSNRGDNRDDSSSSHASGTPYIVLFFAYLSDLVNILLDRGVPASVVTLCT